MTASGRLQSFQGAVKRAGMTISPFWRNVLSAIAVYACVLVLQQMPTNAFPDDSQLYSWYVFVVIPCISAVLSYVLLRGYVVSRLLWLNSAIIGAIASNTAWSLLVDPTLPINFPFVRVVAGLICVVATALFVALHLGSKLIGYVRRAT